MTLYVLDTDHLTLHQRNHPHVVSRIESLSPEELATTVVTLEEQMRGRLPRLGIQGIDLSSAYERLHATVGYFCDLNVLPFDHLARQRDQQLR